MATNTTHPPATEEQDQAPPDIEVMRAAVGCLIGPDDAPEALPPSGDELDTLTLQMRGHIELMVIEVSRTTLKLPKSSIPRFCALACVGEARRKLTEEPRSGLGGRVAHARRLARVLGALCDHHEGLVGATS